MAEITEQRIAEIRGGIAKRNCVGACHGCYGCQQAHEACVDLLAALDAERERCIAIVDGFLSGKVRGITLGDGSPTITDVVNEFRKLDRDILGRLLRGEQLEDAPPLSDRPKRNVSELVSELTEQPNDTEKA